MAARRSIPALLRSLGFCVTIAPTFARAANLSGVSLLVSLVRPLVTRLPTAPLRLPPDATWLQVFPFAPDNEPLDYNGGLHAVDVRFATRVQPAGHSSCRATNLSAGSVSALGRMRGGVGTCPNQGECAIEAADSIAGSMLGLHARPRRP